MILITHCVVLSCVCEKPLHCDLVDLVTQPKQFKRNTLDHHCLLSTAHSATEWQNGSHLLFIAFSQMWIHYFDSTLYNFLSFSLVQIGRGAVGPSKLLCNTTRRNENETQTVPVVLETSVDGGSKPGCYREHWHTVVGVIRMPAPWLIHENKAEKSVKEFIIYVSGSLLFWMWNTPSR